MVLTKQTGVKLVPRDWTKILLFYCEPKITGAGKTMGQGAIWVEKRSI